MQYQIAVIPGDPARENEDYAGVLGTSAVVIDGSGLPGNLPTGCIHGVPWYVRNLGARLLNRMVLDTPQTPLTSILAAAIEQVAAEHAGTCDLTAPGTPSAVLAMVRVEDENLDYLVLGDCTLAIELMDSKIIEITDRRMDAIAADAFQAMLNVPIGTAEKQAARVAFVLQQMPSRNVPGGYPLAGTKPEAAHQAYTGSIPLSTVNRWVMTSDGAARYVEFRLGTWETALDVLSTAGPSYMLGKLRRAEADDAAGERWPRAKLHDDAALIYASYLPQDAVRS